MKPFPKSISFSDILIFSFQRNGETELHYAVLTGDLATVNELVNAGSDPSIRNGQGITPVALAQRLNEDFAFQ
jgi:ankyrin repeat protein